MIKKNPKTTRKPTTNPKKKNEKKPHVKLRKHLNSFVKIIFH